MAYNKENKLLQIIDVLDVYKKHKVDGVSTAYVYRTYIKDRFRISIQTLYVYLATPAEKELQKVRADKQVKKEVQLANQLTLQLDDN
jgi:hypothetical protein